MTRLFKNNVTSELAVAITPDATEIQLLDASSFPSAVPGSQVFMITLEQRSTTFNEICRCTAVNGDKLTIVRGQEGTTPLAFAAFDIVESRLTAAALDEFLIDAPVDGNQYLRRNGVWTISSAIATITAGPPATPQAGQLWWESDSGSLNVWYVDANSAQWVQTNANGLPDAVADGQVYGRKNNAWVLTSTQQDINNAVNLKVSKTGDVMTGPLQIGYNLAPPPSGSMSIVGYSSAQLFAVNAYVDNVGTWRRVSGGASGLFQVNQNTGDTEIYTAGGGTAGSAPGWARSVLFRPGAGTYFDTQITAQAVNSNGSIYAAGQMQTAASMYVNGELIVGYGQTSSRIQMWDNDEGIRSIHCNSGLIGFLNNAGNWSFNVNDGGALWTPQMGDVYSFIINQASSYANSAANSIDYVHRIQMSGYGESGAWNAWATDGPNVITDCFTNMGGFTQRRWRTLQMFLPKQGGWVNIWVS